MPFEYVHHTFARHDTALRDLSRGHLASEIAAFESAIPVRESETNSEIAPILHHADLRIPRAVDTLC